MKTFEKTLARAIDADLDEKELEAAGRGAMLIDPALAGGMTTAAYAGPLLANWKSVSANDVQVAIDLMADAVKGGDLTDLEAMLVAQAASLQSMFTALAAKAAGSREISTVNAITSLALRAQAQSRVTVDSIVNLKFPRQTVFAKQANVNNGGQQQVNNGVPVSHAPAHEAPAPNKIFLESNASPILEPRAARGAGRSNQTLEAVGVGDRTAKRGGQSRGRA